MKSELIDKEELPDAPARPWYRLLNGYHWLVLIVCTLGWLFDCLNQQLFNLARKPAMADLLRTAPGDPTVVYYGSIATAIILVGWATGGIFFGILGDRLGRVKTMVLMILAYSLSTGMAGLAVGPWDFMLYCFLTGLGAGGLFAVGCTLVAESLPAPSRAPALGMLQAFSTLGNVMAGFISLGMTELLAHGLIATPWRWMFSVGILPSLLAIIVMRKLREPEAWKKAVAENQQGGKKVGSLAELFGDPRWRRRAIVGLVLASSGVVGLWGIGVFSNDLTQAFLGDDFDAQARQRGEAQADLQFVASVIASPDRLDLAKRVQPRDLLGTGRTDFDARQMYDAALKLHAEGQRVSPAAVLARLDAPHGDQPAQTAEEKARRAEVLKPTPGTSVDAHVVRILARQKVRQLRTLRWAAVTLMMFNLGGFFGVYGFSRLTQRIGRRKAFAISFVTAGITTAAVFLTMSKTSDLFWMVPLMGAAQFTLFGGYAIYFPELFPTRLRATGTSFCYNVGRYVTAGGVFCTGLLTKHVFGHTSQPLRYAGVTMCLCFVIGLVAVAFAPETKDQPLPE